MIPLLLADVPGPLRPGLLALQTHLAAYRGRGVIEAAAVQTVTGISRALAARAGRPAPAPDVGLALALAVQAPRQGDVCVHLGHVLLAPTDATEPAPDTIPDRAAWVAAVASCDLVAGPESTAQASPFVREGQRLYTRRSWAHQARLAARLRERMVRAPVVPTQPALLAAGLDRLFRAPDDTPPDPTAPLDRQRLAAAQALLGHLLVLTGGPGMGKTWTVRNLLTLLLLEHFAADPSVPPLRIALAAPTGKAAARMSESVSQGLDAAWAGRLAEIAGSPALAGRVHDVLEGLESSTLHRLLGTLPGQTTRFRHDRDDPLPVDVVVVDEASMVDLALMDRLVDAVPDHARLILVGDRDQLASVESGCVLSDLCGPTRADTAVVSQSRAKALEALGLVVAERPAHQGRGGLRRVDDPGPWDHVVQLDRTHRFAADSGIAAFVAVCLAGGEPFDAVGAARVLSDPTRTDVALVPHGAGGTLTPSLARLLVDGEGTGPGALLGFRAAYDALFGGRKASGQPTEAAFHRHVLALFAQIRVLCAHRKGRAGVEGFNTRLAALLEQRIGPLKRTGTWWAGRPVLIRRNDRATGLHNGDIGLVVQAGRGSERRLQVAFPGPDAVPSGPLGAADADALRLVRYVSPARLPEHETTFAMTIHKSQGSEFRHAVVVLPERPSRVLTRELVYTGVTRARRRVTVVGSEDVLVHALQNPVKRWSGLGPAVWRPLTG